MFPAGITPDNCPSTLKPYVIHSYPVLPETPSFRGGRMTIFCFLRVSVFTMGDFPDGNRGCHASHRGSCAVPARPLRGSGFPSHCRNVNGRLAATVPVTPPLARRILRFLHPGKLTPGCGVITAKAVMLFSSSLRCGVSGAQRLPCALRILEHK